MKQNLTSIEMPQSPEHVQLSRVKEVVGSPQSSKPAVSIEVFIEIFAATLASTHSAAITFSFYPKNFRTNSYHTFSHDLIFNNTVTAD